MRRFLAVLFRTFIGLSSAVMFVGALAIWVLTFLFDKRLVLLNLYACFWASIYVWLMLAWKVSISGKENIDCNRTYVVVINHQSLLDILIVFGLFFPFKWVSKSEIFNVPFIGWNMVLNQYIKLKRGDKASVKEMMEHCKHHLRNGSSIAIFPEGTRSNTGHIKAFKPGAFSLAKELSVPILPIAIDGTTHALPKKSLSFHGYHHIKIRVLPAIETEAFKELSVEELSDSVRQKMIEHISTHSTGRDQNQDQIR